MNADQAALTETQQLALEFIAVCSRVSVAEVRREALRSYAEDLLRDPLIGDMVRNALRYRREHGVHRPVTTLRSIR